MFTTCISIFTYLYLRSFYKNKLIKFKSVGLRYDICIIFNGIIIVFRLTWIRFQRKTHCNRHRLFLIQYSWFIYSQKSMEAYNINNSIKQSSCFTFSRWWRYGQLKFTLTHFSGISHQGVQPPLFQSLSQIFSQPLFQPSLFQSVTMQAWKQYLEY